MKKELLFKNLKVMVNSKKDNLDYYGKEIMPLVHECLAKLTLEDINEYGLD